jgi:hypothetical protein
MPDAGFIARWQGVTGRERASYQLFLTELTGVLDLPAHEPVEADDGANANCFERWVAFRHGDGSESYGYAGLYRLGAFVLEAEDVKAPEWRRQRDLLDDHPAQPAPTPSPRAPRRREPRVASNASPRIGVKAHRDWARGYRRTGTSA